ncbi:hypothetical protein DH2020_021963 [Rehmannia glutinosa]|uniref:Uncharacterized protein n=1 Tax=Rehmannia glutinosa TaxID=99300 RepID=A0ABR0WE70_REHGL
MAFTIKQMSLTVATLGVLSFIFGVIAENKKPAAGTPITGKGVVICKYPSDPSVVLGYLSTAFLAVCTFAEQLHHVRNIHHDLETKCPIAKTGILGGGAFVSLDSCLFWLVALMLADNVRADYFEESDEKVAAIYGADEPLKTSAWIVWCYYSSD